MALAVVALAESNRCQIAPLQRGQNTYCASRLERARSQRVEVTITMTTRDSPQKPVSTVKLFRQPASGSRAAEIIDLVDSREITIDRANTLLMDHFRQHHDAEAYAALYQLNYKTILGYITSRTSGFTYICPADVLQDVFLLIYRYPHNFRAEHERSFFNWSRSIIINTIRKKLKKQPPRTFDIDSIRELESDQQTNDPLNRVILSEEVEQLKRLYSISLMIYLKVYSSRLTPREKEALHLIEVKQVPYRDAAEELSIRYENFKMLICRARKKIAQGLRGITQRIETWQNCDVPKSC